MGTSIQARAGNQTISLVLNRPRFQDLWRHYPVNMPAPDVYQKVGGKAYELYLSNPEAYANACALRLSRSLNYGGMPIPAKTKGYLVTGSDGKRYFLRVKDVIAFLKKNLGSPDIEMDIKDSGNVSHKFKHNKGIIVFIVSGWGDATGHVTLWEGALCGDSCYFTHNSPSIKTTKILFWNLK